MHGLGPIGLGNVLLAMSVGTIVGTLLLGPLDRVFKTRKWLIMACMAVAAAALGALAAVPGAGLWTAVPSLCVLGLSSAFIVHTFAHGRAFFPDRMVGRVMTTVNFANFAGVGLMQVATGLLVGAFPAVGDGGEGAAAPEAAYRLVFAFLAATLVIAMWLYRRTPDAPPRGGLGGG